MSQTMRKAPSPVATQGQEMTLPQPITDPKIVDVVKVITYADMPTAKRLNKISYLAELVSIARRGTRLTRTPFIRYRFGPYSPDVAQAAEKVPDDIDVESFVSRHGKTARRFVPRNARAKGRLSSQEFDVVKEALNLARGMDTEALTTLLDNTAPFVWTRVLGEQIDFNRYASLLDMAKAVERAGNRGHYVRLSSPKDVRTHFGMA